MSMDSLTHILIYIGFLFYYNKQVIQVTNFVSNVVDTPSLLDSIVILGREVATAVTRGDNVALARLANID